MEMQTTKICSAESTSLEVSQLLWSIRSHPDSKTTQIHKQDATSYKKAIYPCRTDVHQLPLFCGAPLMQTSYWKPVWTHRTYQKNSSMCVSFPDGARLYLRALGSAFVAALTCLSLCWHAGRHLRTCHVELACSDIHTRARTIGDLLAAHEHVWIMLVFSSAVKPAFPLWGVCVCVVMMYCSHVTACVYIQQWTGGEVSDDACTQRQWLPPLPWTARQGGKRTDQEKNKRFTRL